MALIPCMFARFGYDKNGSPGYLCPYQKCPHIETGIPDEFECPVRRAFKPIKEG